MSWVCCSCCDGEETEEKIPIISNETLMYFAKEAQQRRSELPNMWSEIRGVSLQERDDEEVRNLFHKRAKTRRGSQGYRRLSLDIQSALQEREDMLDKWKFILESLGFGAEADAMLTVTTSSSYSSLRNALEAERLLDILAQESNIFDKRVPAERYIYVLDCLISLDAAQDFVSKAKSCFPPGRGAERDVVAVLVKADEVGLVSGEELEEVDEEAALSTSLEL